MQSTSPATLATPIPLPRIEGDEPLAVIPVASAAPLDGPPDGERINTFALTPKANRSGLAASGANVRDLVIRKPLTSVIASFALGLILARALR